MKPRYVCVGCQGAACPRCSGRGWVREFFVQVERTNSLVEAVAKNLIQKKIAAVGPEEWARRAAKENLTTDQFTEIEIWPTTGPVKYQFMGLTDEVIDALCRSGRDRDSARLHGKSARFEGGGLNNVPASHQGMDSICLPTQSSSGVGPGHHRRMESPVHQTAWGWRLQPRSPSEPEFGSVCRSGREPQKRSRRETVIHEACHCIVGYKHGVVAHHGSEWKTAMKNCGVEPLRNHTVDRTGLARRRRLFILLDCPNEGLEKKCRIHARQFNLVKKGKWFGARSAA